MNTDKQQEKNDDQQYPGYPHYPAADDITQPDNNNGRVLNEEPKPNPTGNDATDGDTHIVMGTEADVTDEDLRLLDQADQGMAEGDEAALINSGLDDTDLDGEKLNEESFADDLTGSDLDVPGSEADDADEAMGEEDEENNYYSLGGDGKDD